MYTTLMEVMLGSTNSVEKIKINNESEAKTAECKDVKSCWPVQRRRGLRSAVRIVERDLWIWYLTQNGKVSKNNVQLQARNKFQKAGIPNFKASDGWYKRWTRRWRSTMLQHQGKDATCPSDDIHSTSLKTQAVESSDPNTNHVYPQVGEELSDKVDDIVTPSLGDTLESTFPSLETSRLLSEQTENRFLWDDAKDDTRLTTPQHNSFEQYSLVSKVLKLKYYCEEQEQSLVLDHSHGLDEKEKDENIVGPVCTSKIEDSNGLTKTEGVTEEAEAGGGGVGGGRGGAPLRPRRSLQQQHVGKRYHSHFKERVLSYLKSHTFKETARKFGVHQGSISAWHKDKLRLRLKDEHLSNGISLVSEPAPADVQFLSWLRMKRGCRITSLDVRDSASRLVSLAGGLLVVERQVRWFALWVKRLQGKPQGMTEKDFGDDASSCEDDRRVQYPTSFRTEVAAFAAQFSQMAAVRTFHVSRKRVFEWLRAYHGNSFAKNVCDIPGSGRCVTDPEVDQQVWQWYCDRQDKKLGDGRLPTSKEVRAHAASLYAKRGLSSRVSCSYGWFRRWCERFGVRLRYTADDELLAWALAQLDCNHALSHALLQEQARQLWRVRRPDFKASPGWAIRFCKRYPALLQAAPTVNTPLPEPLRPLVCYFRSSVQDLVQLHRMTTSAVGNMDELPLGFSAPPAGVPKRQLLLRKPGMDTCHATVVLSCLADGSLLPTMLILKDVVDFQNVPQNLVVVQQERGQMDLNCMLKWLDCIWFRHVPRKSLLVADKFDPHCSPEVTSKFGSDGSNDTGWLMHIPAGCSSKLQPLDISVKSSFQRFIDQRWESLNSRSGTNWACNGQQLRLPTSQELIQWVADAHDFISTARQETVRRSFLVTGLLLPDNHCEDQFIENLAALPTEEDSPEL